MKERPTTPLGVPVFRTGLQLTRIQEEPDRWIVRAWHDGHGCDVEVDKLNPPYFTYPGEGHLAIADASGDTIASTVWKINAPARPTEELNL